MSEPIVEQIAVWLKDALGDITRAKGYQQDLTVYRPEDTWLDSKYIKDGSAIVVQAGAEPDGEGTMEELFWVQTFEITVCFTAVPDDALSLDTRINRAAADIHKRLGLEQADIVTNNGTLCNGLAYRFDYSGIEIDVHEDLDATLLTFSLGIAYAVSRLDPYTQI